MRMGEVAIASIGDEGLDVHARHSVLTDNAWTPPTLVDGTLYVRDRRMIVGVGSQRLTGASGSGSRTPTGIRLRRGAHGGLEP